MKKVDNTKLGFWDKLVPHYKDMWQIAKNQGWICCDCKKDIGEDPEWTTPLVKERFRLL